MTAVDCPFAKYHQRGLPVHHPRLPARLQLGLRRSATSCGEDILQIASDTTDREHFLGSVVYISTGNTAASFARWLLIDGQQRVTTLTLLLAALRDHIEQTGWSGTEDGPTARRIEAYFLKNVEEEGRRRPKLMLRRHDQATLQAILDGNEPPQDPSERIRDNYEWFCEQLAEVDPELVYCGINRLRVVEVTLHRAQDDPQLIFESLNSTGMDLSQSDLIRKLHPDAPARGGTKRVCMRPTGARSRASSVAPIEPSTPLCGTTSHFGRVRTKQEKADKIYFAFRRAFGSIGNGNRSASTSFSRTSSASLVTTLLFSLGAHAAEPLREPLKTLAPLGGRSRHPDHASI